MVKANYWIDLLACDFPDPPLKRPTQKTIAKHSYRWSSGTSLVRIVDRTPIQSGHSEYRIVFPETLVL